MVLPSGVNKATGLSAALVELGLSRHNVVAVGDAENDHALRAQLLLSRAGDEAESQGEQSAAVPADRRRRRRRHLAVSLEERRLRARVRHDVKDAELADAIAQLSPSLSAADSRAAIRAEIEKRYTLPADQASGLIEQAESGNVRA